MSNSRWPKSNIVALDKDCLIITINIITTISRIGHHSQFGAILVATSGPILNLLPFDNPPVTQSHSSSNMSFIVIILVFCCCCRRFLFFFRVICAHIGRVFPKKNYGTIAVNMNTIIIIDEILYWIIIEISSCTQTNKYLLALDYSSDLVLCIVLKKRRTRREGNTIRWHGTSSKK